MALRSERRILGRNELIKSGMLVQFTYQKEDSTKSQYTVLVIDPNKDSQLHSIVLDDLSDADVFRMVLELAQTIQFVPYDNRASLANLKSDEMYNRYKSSAIRAERRYRTFVVDRITNARQILTGALAGLPVDVETKKVKIGNSVAYGVEHTKFVYVNYEDYATLYNELTLTNNNTYFEGNFEGAGHEDPTKTLLSYIIGNKYSSKTWDPDENQFEEIRKELMYDKDFTDLATKLAGWFGQTFDDGQGGPNLKGEWDKTSANPTDKIGDVFKKSVGETTYNLFLENFTEYRISKQTFITMLNQPGYDTNGNPTTALEIVNLAGHDHLFPEDANLPAGKLKQSEIYFNTIRRTHLIRTMQNQAGVYFVGWGHIEELEKMI
jgi:hypothetical protein